MAAQNELKFNPGMNPTEAFVVSLTREQLVLLRQLVMRQSVSAAWREGDPTYDLAVKLTEVLLWWPTSRRHVSTSTTSSPTTSHRVGEKLIIRSMGPVSFAMPFHEDQPGQPEWL